MSDMPSTPQDLKQAEVILNPWESLFFYDRDAHNRLFPCTMNVRNAVAQALSSERARIVGLVKEALNGTIEYGYGLDGETPHSREMYEKGHIDGFNEAQNRVLKAIETL